MAKLAKKQPKKTFEIQTFLKKRHISIALIVAVVLGIFLAVSSYHNYTAREALVSLVSEKGKIQRDLRIAKEASVSARVAYETLKNEDQYKINQDLKKNISDIQSTYKDSIGAYEKMQDLKAQKQNVSDLEVRYIELVKLLGDFKYEDAKNKLNDLNGEIKKINDKLAAEAAARAAAAAAASGGGGGAPAPENNTPPGSGYSYQGVKTEIGTYNVSIVAADLGSTRVIVDTASDSTCTNDCPVLSLGDYVGRNGAFAGINGSYFCPASYPSCAGKTNSFDTLLMNKNKVYFNSDNNVYSNVPVAVFSAGSARFIGASSGWGRDTGVDGVIANQPLLVSGGAVVFGGGSDPKQGSKGARSFVGNKGSTVYIGVVYNATVAEVAIVLKTMGLDNALNLDSGGSTALWSGGYKVGPGRNIPNAILFVRR